jgi:hypothetical protein
LWSGFSDGRDSIRERSACCWRWHGNSSKQVGDSRCSSHGESIQDTDSARAMQRVIEKDGSAEYHGKRRLLGFRRPHHLCQANPRLSFPNFDDHFAYLFLLTTDKLSHASIHIVSKLRMDL